MARRRARPTLRLLALLGALIVSLGAVAGRLVLLQVVNAPEFEALGSRQRVRRTELPAKRGPIYDRNMVPLALSIEARSIYADPRAVVDPRATAGALAPLLGARPAEIQEKLRREAAFVYLARKVDLPVADRILALDLPGIGAIREVRRVYPGGALAGQVLGFVGTDNTGLSGLEYGYEQQLGGKSGEEIGERDPHGREIPHGRNSVRPPEPGGGLVLTIDRDIQYAAEEALAAAKAKTRALNGVAIVLNPRSGDVLAMANWPPLDPGRFSSFRESVRRNRAVTDSYEPGSVNKVVTAAAAIEAGLVAPSDRFSVPDSLRIRDKTFHEYEPHPVQRMTYGQILARSSNIGTIKIAMRIGGARVQRMLERFGLGRRTGLGFPGEADGIVLPFERWSGTSIGTIPIGQGIAVTPLQMAMVYATIANDGVRVQPRLVRANIKPDGRVVPLPRGERRRVVSAYAAAQVRSMLVGVVEEGTGRTARVPGYLIAGKTGTARVPRPDAPGYSNQIITTFIGMLPAEAPRLVVLVALNNPRPRVSALTAAPAFRDITRFAVARLGILPTFPTGVAGRPALAQRRR